jgi:predicted phage terminase large subunit-like protein
LSTAAQLTERLEAIEHRLELHKLRRLRYFVEAAWHVVEPDKEFVPNWHIDALCEELEAVTRGDVKRLIINIPPGCMKSLIVSVFWPAWEWTFWPSLRYLCASFDQDLVIRDNMKVRDIVQSQWYRENWPDVELTGDQNAKEKFANVRGGWRRGTTVKGGGTGEHPDRIVIDDPHSAKQAKSKVEREAANTWFDSTISTRGLTRDVAIVVIMQRLHEEDLTGHLLKKNEATKSWRHVKIPMEYELPKEGQRTSYSYDPRRKAGELLWPQLVTVEKLRVLKIELGQYGVSGQLQQRPSPQGGGIFKRAWFVPVQAAPAVVVKRVRGWDTASTEGGGDYTAGVKISRDKDGIFYIEHVARGQWSPADVDKNIRNTAVMDGKKTAIREEQEGGSAGKAVTGTRARDLAGFDYRGVAVTGDKETRATPLRAQAEAGNVRIVVGPWNEEYLDELEMFPNGVNDDQVDGSSCSFNEITTGPRPVRTVPLSMG